MFAMPSKCDWPGMAGFMSCLLAACVAFATDIAWAQAGSPAALALLEQYTAMDTPLKQNAYGRPLVLHSIEAKSGLKGDIYAVMAYPMKAVSTGLKSPEHWCKVMMLHINTKYCRAMAKPQGTTLRVFIGKKTPQEVADAAQVDFSFRETADTPTYFSITLLAKDGPLSTSDYHIGLEAVALPGNQTFLHLGYAYGVGLPGRLAMKLYLATVGADKVGFTQTGQLPSGQPQLIGGVRAVVERNAMRYFLAIESYLATQNLPPEKQPEARLQDWFTAVERYPRQLHDLDRTSYLVMKRAEYTRLRTVY
jgi:hypothetical protein